MVGVVVVVVVAVVVVFFVVVDVFVIVLVMVVVCKSEGSQRAPHWTAKQIDRSTYLQLELGSPKTSNYLVNECLNPQTSPEVRLLGVPKTDPLQVLGGFWMSKICVRPCLSLVKPNKFKLIFDKDSLGLDGRSPQKHSSKSYYCRVCAFLQGRSFCPSEFLFFWRSNNPFLQIFFV